MDGKGLKEEIAINIAACRDEACLPPVRDGLISIC